MPAATPVKSRDRAPTPTGRAADKVTAATKGNPKTPAAKGKGNGPTGGPVEDSQAASPQNDGAQEGAEGQAGGQHTNVTVAVRVKPSDGAKTIMRYGPRAENSLRFCFVDGSKSDEPKGFSFDHVFDGNDTQQDVYNALGAPVLQQVCNGFNASVFAYGQTGSGKTHTMLGRETPDERGLIPRLCEELFQKPELKGWNVTVSYFEIYNEQVVDLLGNHEVREENTSHQEWTGVGLAPGRKVPVLNALRVREGKTGVYVEGLTKEHVTHPSQIADALRRGTLLRSVAETAMNAESSRSHAVVQLCLAETEGKDRTATLNLIDLAGSENVNRSRSWEDNTRLTEARSINKSLLGLGKCISMLAQAEKGPVPYRESVLTWLLKDALGGNSYSLMLCAVDPSPENGEQTLTTLRYADQAKKIVTRPVENVDHAKRMVRELHDQVAQLRAQAEEAAREQALARQMAAEAREAARAAAQQAEAAAAERAQARLELEAAREQARSELQMERAERTKREEQLAQQEQEWSQKEDQYRRRAQEQHEVANAASVAAGQYPAGGQFNHGPAGKGGGSMHGHPGGAGGSMMHGHPGGAGGSMHGHQADAGGSMMHGHPGGAGGSMHGHPGGAGGPMNSQMGGAGYVMNGAAKSGFVMNGAPVPGAPSQHGQYQNGQYQNGQYQGPDPKRSQSFIASGLSALTNLSPIGRHTSRIKGGGDGGGGSMGGGGAGPTMPGAPVVFGAPAMTMPQEIDMDAVLRMSREEKIAFAKRLKEERKALHTALGIEEEPKVIPSVHLAGGSADASEGGPISVELSSVAGSTTRSGSPPLIPPPDSLVFAFKCLGFLFTMQVVPEQTPR
eukprot:jgi/Chrpa1/22227/Chrysochromulina_OHIO_Genome00012814-RA